jgi:malate dehydrogenase
MRVTVVGSGFVGQTTAMRLVERDLADVVLIDIVEGLGGRAQCASARSFRPA